VRLTIFWDREVQTSLGGSIVQHANAWINLLRTSCTDGRSISNFPSGPTFGSCYVPPLLRTVPVRFLACYFLRLLRCEQQRCILWRLRSDSDMPIVAQSNQAEAMRGSALAAFTVTSQSCQQDAAGHDSCGCWACVHRTVWLASDSCLSRMFPGCSQQLDGLRWSNDCVQEWPAAPQVKV